MKPFLKWAGNKYPLIEQIKAILPPGRRLVEPFVGSGALFLNTDYDEYILADANADLINLYQQVQRFGPLFIDFARRFFCPENNTAAAYYRLRDRFNQLELGQEKAALFIYLNKHCYNGLCRYNRRGKFNVPFGRYTRPYFPETELLLFHTRAQKASFRVQPFEVTLRAAQAGDVVYCDPPYVPLSTTANFTSYSMTRFGDAEQHRLAELAGKLAECNIPVIISNHDTAFTRKVYQRASRLLFFPVQRYISRNGAKRTKADELLAFFQPTLTKRDFGEPDFTKGIS